MALAPVCFETTSDEDVVKYGDEIITLMALLFTSEIIFTSCYGVGGMPGFGSMKSTIINPNRCSK
jgi:hypothetical protein